MANIIITLLRKVFRNLRYEIEFSKPLGDLEGKIKILTSENLKAKGRIAIRFLKTGEEIVCRNYRIIKDCVYIEDEGADTWELCNEYGNDILRNNQYPRMFHCCEFGENLLLFNVFSDAVVIKSWTDGVEVVKRYSKSLGNYQCHDRVLVLAGGDKQYVFANEKFIGAYDVVKSTNGGLPFICKNLVAPNEIHVIHYNGKIDKYSEVNIKDKSFLEVTTDCHAYGVISGTKVIIPQEYERFEYPFKYGVTFAKRCGETEYVLLRYSEEFKEYPEKYKTIESFFEEMNVGIFKLKLACVVDENSQHKYIDTQGEEVDVKKFQDA